jgi:hypothetical protein
MLDRNVISERDVASLRAVLGNDSPQVTLTADTYKDRLVKYIPPDVIGAFTAIEGLLNGSKSPFAAPLGWIVFIVISLTTPFYLVKIGGIRKPLQVCISTAAFLIWAFAYPGPPFGSLPVDPLISSVILALFTFLVPLVSV